MRLSYNLSMERLDNLRKERCRRLKEPLRDSLQSRRLLQCYRFSRDNDLCGKLSWANHYERIKGIYSGLTSLHKKWSTSVSHSDLKPQNILLDIRCVPKISDFGISRFLHGSHNTAAPKVRAAGTHNSPSYVEFAVAASAKGGAEIKIGSHVIRVPKYLSVHHPLVQMVLFARNKFADTFACCKSMAPKSIFDMAKRLHASALSNWGKTIWNSAKPKAESPKVGTFSDFSTGQSIVRRNELTENESHPSDTDASGAAWVAATAAPHHATGNRDLLAGFIIEHDDQFVHAVDGVPRKVLARGAVITDSVVLPDVWFVPGLTGNLVSVSQLVELDHSHDDRLQVPMAHEGACIYYIILDKMPTAAGSVKCGDADESSMLAKQTSPQQQFVLNSSGDGGSGDPLPNSALRVTPFVETAFTPMVPELIEVDPQHPRKIGLASEDDILKADYIFIHMMVGSHGISADRSMQYIIILDSGAAYHCTGDRSQLSDYCDGVAPVAYLRGAGGTLMRVHGTGSIHNENFQVKGVLYVPGLNNQPNINKTIFSVSKLNELGFSVLFNCDGTSSVMNLEHEIVGKARHVHGLFMMDYLRIPDNRAPVAMLVGRGPGLVKSLWNASLSVWTSITGRLSQRTTYAQRLPV